MGELVKINENLIIGLDKKSVAEIIKPLKKEIFLLNYYVSDINELCSDVLFVKIKENDEMQLRADNMVYRKTSVGVYFNEQRIGELYEGEEIIPYNLLTAGKELKATVKRVHLSMGKKILLLSVKMIDF